MIQRIELNERGARESLGYLQFFVPGDPKPQERPRHVMNTTTGRVHTYSPKDKGGWRDTVAVCAQKANKNWGSFYSQPVVVRIEFIMPRPKSLKTPGMIPHVKAPDVDNLAKGVLDGLNDSEIWEDDARVVGLKVTKRYVRLIATERTGALITIEKWFPEW